MNANLVNLMSRLMHGMLLTAMVACASTLDERAAFAQWGDIQGQFVFDGDPPQLEDLVKKGNSAVKDASVCAAESIPDDSLVVNSSNKGIANVFVFLRKADKVHPDLKRPAASEVILDQKHCRFVPHALVVRTDQSLICKSDDNCPHNTHSFPSRNNSENFVLAPNDRTGIPIKFKLPEAAPISVKCDIHSWMNARLLVVDHPYAAVTDADGKFKIEKLPVGTHKFRVWHERPEVIEKEWTIEVKAGLNVVPTVKLTAEKLAPKK
jgi:hypothetical protein